MNIEEIGKLAEIMRQTGLTLIENHTGTETLRLERSPGSTAPFDSADTSVIGIHSAPSVNPASQPAAPATAVGSTVLSPMVGVFYTAPSPDSSPFVQLGDKVKKGDVLCIIEAMKLMNEIQAEADGTISEICVGNGQVVEYDQPLFRIVT